MIRSVAALALTLVLVVGCSFGGDDARETGGSGVVETVGSGEAVLNQPAPDFTLTTTSGERIALTELQGRPILLNFWATWCGPCRVEMPELQAVYDRYQPAGLEVIGVEVDSSGSAADSADFLREVGISFPVTRDVGSQLEGAYLLRNALPTTVLIDQEGDVAYIHLGAITEDFLIEKLSELGL